MERAKVVQRPESKGRSKKPATVAAEPAGMARTASPSYTVVARRYRPQRFDDVVGQDHVVKALRNAIRMNRIAQAYLFCGTRGVGKTSIARIFAKCLNCVKGPTEEPCQTCDICQSIALGQDVDVIEIDGASNNGVEQVRELRQNAALRPSRARFKVYYIDEVHMLSTGAFNALLKTLEEPPPHVKFFFATTEANKIPVTVLSRCQRYDFAGITPEVIAGTLRAICEQEKVEADPEALHVVARRASGSLRDAQSLLDRLLASGSPRLTVEVVNALLGTASDERLLAMIEALADHDSAAALRLIEQCAGDGVQPAELLSGIIEFVRDALVMAVGAESMLLSVSARQRPRLKTIVERWTVDSILASLQVLSECRARMRGSSHGRLLLELAVVRVARLEGLTDLGTLVERLAKLETGAPTLRKPDGGGRRRSQAPPEAPGSPAEPAPPVLEPPVSLPGGKPLRKAAEPRDLEPAQAPEPRSIDRPQPPSSTGPSAIVSAPENPTVLQVEAGTHQTVPVAESSTLSHGNGLSSLDLSTARKIWPDLLKKVGAGLGWRLSQVEPVAVEAPGILVIAAKSGYNAVADECGTAESLARIEQALQRLTHRQVTLKYERSPEVDDGNAVARTGDGSRLASLSSDPLVQKVIELFEARFLPLGSGDQDPNQPT